MKKIAMLAVAAALLGISAPNFAQVPGSSQPSSTQQDDRDQDVGTSGSESGTQSGTGTGTTGSGSQQPGTSGSQSGTGTGTSGSMSQYNQEVEASNLPAAVTMTLSEDYPGYKTEKAYKANDGTYKVKVSKGDEKQTLFFDQKGEAIKMPKSGTGTGVSGTGTGTSGTHQPGTSGSQSGTSTPSGTSTGTGTSGSGTGTSGAGTGVGTGSSMSSDYSEEVKTSELPAAITRSLNEKYPGYKADKAHKAKDGTYKVTVSKGDEKQTLFFDERGESVKMQK